MTPLTEDQIKTLLGMSGVNQLMVRIVRAVEQHHEPVWTEMQAELIYLRQHGKDGAVWTANDSKDVWREKARTQ